jgi:hypothetical protein
MARLEGTSIAPTLLPLTGKASLVSNGWFAVAAALGIAVAAGLLTSFAAPEGRRRRSRRCS